MPRVYLVLVLSPYYCNIVYTSQNRPKTGSMSDGYLVYCTLMLEILSTFEKYLDLYSSTIKGTWPNSAQECFVTIVKCYVCCKVHANSLVYPQRHPFHDTLLIKVNWWKITKYCCTHSFKSLQLSKLYCTMVFSYFYSFLCSKWSTARQHSYTFFFQHLHGWP